MDVIKNVSVLTTIPESSIRKLIEKAEWTICDSIVNSDKNESLSFSVGIGDIKITANDDQIIYQFIPNKQFESMVRDAYIDNVNPLKINLEKLLVSKIVNTYKDIF